MRAGFRMWRWKIKQHPVGAIVVLVGSVLGIALIVVVILGYTLNWHWTGLVPETSEPQQNAKTLWDWLQLLAVLAIPAAVGLGTIWFSRQQAKVSDAENKDNQREAALQAYIDKMSELLLEKKLRESAEEDEVRTIARVRTLTVLRGLDMHRKASVLQFLHESGLINKNKCIINLSNAPLREAELVGALLYNANLEGSVLRRANLLYANLFGADLSRADLYGAYLYGAHLYEADLSGANLEGTILEEADLSGANLKGALGITTEELEKQAKSLKGATMPDGSLHS